MTHFSTFSFSAPVNYDSLQIPDDILQTINRNETMNFNDPFGRMASKHQREYESLRNSLKKKGLNTPADAQALLEKLQQRGKWGLAIIFTTSLLLSLIFSDLLYFFLLCGTVAVFWLIKTTAKGQEYVNRYIREELNGSDPL